MARKLKWEDVENFDTKDLTHEELLWYDKLLKTIPKEDNMEEKEIKVNVTTMTAEEAAHATARAAMDWLFASDEANQFPKGWSTPDLKLKNRYAQAIRAAKTLEKKGLVKIRKVDNPEIPWYYHTINLTWLEEKPCAGLGFDAKDSKYAMSLLKDMDLLFDAERGDEWQIGREIYKVKPEYEGRQPNPTDYVD